MQALRPLLVLVLSAIPSVSATFGTPVTDPANPVTFADIALDEARQQLYVVNTAANEIEVYSTRTKPPKQTASIQTEATPLSIAMSRSGQYLYVTCYNASALDVIDLSSPAYATQSITLAARPEGVAVGFNEKVLISTIGTGNGRDVLITYDPTVAASKALSSVPVVPSAPNTPTLPPPNGVMFLASNSRLQASQDGTIIVGVNELASNNRTVFVYDAASSVVLASRTVPQRSPVLAVSPDGSQFLSGPMLFETSTLFVLAQQNTTNSPYTFPTGANLNNTATQANQGGAVYLPDGSELLAAYNIAPLANPVSRPNISQLLVNRPGNLLTTQGIQLPETFSGKMVITSDGSTIYALSQSGFTVLSLSALRNSPIAMPDSKVALLAFDNCGVTAAQSSAAIAVRNTGRGRITVNASLVAAAIAAAANNTGRQSTTSPALRTTPGGKVVATFNPRATASPGTVPPDQVLIQSPEAVNIPPNVWVFQNYRSPEAARSIIPVDIGASSTGLTDMLLDAPRQLIYIANPGLNRIEVFDIQQQKFVDPISTGQLPRSLAFGADGNTLYVAESGGETIGIVDLTKMVRTGRVSFPPLPFNSSLAVITPMMIASSQQGPQVIMSNGTMWRIVGNTVIPRTLNPSIFGTATSIPGPQTMVSTGDGNYVLVLAGNGWAYLYSAAQDDFVSGRQLVPTPIRGYYGPVAAGPSGEYYLVNGQVLNNALTQVGGTTATTSRPVTAVAAVDANTYAQFSMPVRSSATAAVTDAGIVQTLDAKTGQVKASANALEGPLTVLSGTGRANIMGRTMVIGPTGARAYVLTASGLSIVPLAPANTQNAPSVPGGGLVNAASFTPGVAPDGLVSIFGTNLADTASASATPLPTILGGTCVTLNTTPLPLLATSAGQINAQIPPGTAATRQSLVVHSIANHVASGGVNVAVSHYAPAIFVDSNGAAIYHANGQRVDKNHPATRDEPLTIYATGLGATTGGRVNSGMPSPSSPLAVTGAVNLYFGDPSWSQAGIIVDWSGLAPGMIGVYQINCRIPGNHINGDGLPVTLKIGGVSSPTTGPTAAVVYVH